MDAGDLIRQQLARATQLPYALCCRGSTSTFAFTAAAPVTICAAGAGTSGGAPLASEAAVAAAAGTACCSTTTTLYSAAAPIGATLCTPDIRVGFGGEAWAGATGGESAGDITRQLNSSALFAAYGALSTSAPILGPRGPASALERGRFVLGMDLSCCSTPFTYSDPAPTDICTITAPTPSTGGDASSSLLRPRMLATTAVARAVADCSYCTTGVYSYTDPMPAELLGAAAAELTLLLGVGAPLNVGYRGTAGKTVSEITAEMATEAQPCVRVPPPPCETSYFDYTDPMAAELCEERNPVT